MKKEWIFENYFLNEDIAIKDPIIRIMTPTNPHAIHKSI